mmetsp:Transcript_19015/g.24488  ORF Transcript_19015/g.24488 Transcript_19015/m.24488 type:complete len:258 (+) Transcript_19015:40-813(+)
MNLLRMLTMMSIRVRNKPLVSRKHLWTGVFVSLRCFSHVYGLNVAVITGTTRNEGPPRPILGPRVSSFVVQGLERRGHSVSIIDPRELQLKLLEKAEFSYARSQVPEELKSLQKTLASADAYVAITPEYNHAPSPALLNVLNHFGSSTFSFKPSAIVSYSASQWGGTRAANALRPILSELGCLPVSAMVHIPKAHEVLTSEGVIEDGVDRSRWDSYIDRCLAQLEWWGEASKEQKSRVDPFASSPAFRKSPSERDAL